MSDGLPQPGWYEDPRHEDDLRWWDGSSWTAHTTARPRLPAPPARPPSPPTGAGAAGTPFPPSEGVGPGPGTQRPVDGNPGAPKERPRVGPPSSPGGQPNIEIAGTSHVLASWWSRAGAYVIDSLIKLAFLVPAIVVAVVLAAGIDWQAIDLERIQDGQTADGRVPGLSAADTAKLGGAILVAFAGWLLVELTYQPMTMARKGANNGRTWGMQALGIRVMRDNGDAMTYLPAMVREFLVMGVLYSLVSTFGNAVTVIGGTLIVLVFYLWPLWDPQNRAAQDFICSTHVVAERR